MTFKKETFADLARRDFPLLSNLETTNQSLIYLDHAATSQKPYEVLQTLEHYYSYYNSNVHRGAHQLSAKATEAFEQARHIAAEFVRATSSREILFTRNASEAINLVARSWGDSQVGPGDEILLTVMEHHSNLVPWQMLAERTGCKLRHVGITPHGELDIDDLSAKLSKRTRLVSFVHISNTLGCCNPVREVSNLAKRYGALVLLDACQSLAHMPIDVSSLGIDFLVGSSHKLCGPTGIGFLWAREELLEKMPPFLGGGEMIQDVYLEHSTWAALPHKFEAGTPAIGEAIAMGTALNYLKKLSLEAIQTWEKTLTAYLYERMSEIEGLQILGPPPKDHLNRGALVTFNVKGVHANDIAAILDTSGICIRSGHHCCQPLHRHYGLTASARASMSFTTTIQELDKFVEELRSSIEFLRTNT